MLGRLQTLVLFYKPNLRVQPLRELFAIAGVAAGVALLFAVQVAQSSVTGSFEEITHGVAGRATLELAARGPAGFDQHISEEVEEMPDVKAAAPVFQQPIVAVGAKGRRPLTLLGATEQILPLGGKLSSAFQRAAEGNRRGLVILTESTADAIGARPGDELTILASGRTEHLTLDATVASSKLGAASGSPIGAAPLAVVQSLAGAQGRISRILIEPRRGREHALLRALDARYGQTLNPRPVATEAKLLGAAAAPEKQVTLLFSAISLVAGIILAFNALLLASQRRRRFVANLVEIAAPESMILATLAFDALVLGVFGVLFGLAAGEVISRLAYGSLPGYIAAAFPIGGQRIVSLQTVLLAVGGGLLAAFAAAVVPALTILRSTGAVADKESLGRTFSLALRVRLSDTLIFACGLVFISGSIAASLLAPATTVGGLIALALGLVLCLPMGTRYLLGLARTLSLRSGDAPTQLSVAELRTAPARSVALLATGAIATLLMVLIGGSVADVKHAARTGATDLFSSGQLWIKPGGPENVYTTQPFAYVETKRRLEQTRTVASVLPWRDAFLDLPKRRVWVLGVPPQLAAQIAPSQLIDGSLAVADRRLREGGWAAISQTIARERHLHLGEAFTLPTPSGNHRLRLAATIANYGWLPGAIVMNGDEQARLWRSSAATELSVGLRAGVPIGRGRDTVRAALPREVALHVQTAAERRAEVSSVLGSTLSRLNATTLVVLVATIVSVITLMASAIWQREGRIEELSALGLSSGQFARLVSYESGLMLLNGCLLGVGAGLLGQYLIDGWLHETTGASLRYAPAWLLGLRTVGIAAVICAVASTIVVAQGRAAARGQESYSIE
jgi:putative ABC transport system permease protein